MDKDQELDQAKHDWIRNSLTYVQVTACPVLE